MIRFILGMVLGFCSIIPTFPEMPLWISLIAFFTVIYAMIEVFFIRASYKISYLVYYFVGLIFGIGVGFLL